MLDSEIADALDRASGGWRRAVGYPNEQGAPFPAMSASLAYYDAYGSADLPQNLIQAQRDYFGAHTFERRDKPDEGPFHSEWNP
jgi:6-phosphogluconate dehydrogenase